MKIFIVVNYDEKHIHEVLNNSEFRFEKIDFIEKKIAENLASGK